MSYLGNAPRFGDYPVKTFTGNGSLTSFSLDHSVPSDASIIVSIDGVRQHVGSYTAAGTAVLDFGAGNAPANLASIEVVHLGLEATLNTPADGSVTNAKLASDIAFGSITIQNNFFNNWNAVTATQTTTIASTENAGIIGPITVNSGITWTIVGTLQFL